MPPPILLPVLLVLSGCGFLQGPASSTPAPDPATSATVTSTPGATTQLLIDFDRVTAEFGTLLPEAVNAGSTPVRTEISTVHAGRIRLAPGPSGDGAARFPAYDGTASAPAAALLVWDETEGDLSPGKRDFTFGVTFMLDAVSDGEDSDNGDNLVQRGLFADEQQLKIQVDHGVPSCRIAGTDGEVVAKWTGPVRRDTWVSVRCSRVGKEVTLEMLDATTGESRGTVTETGSTGALDFPLTTPFGIGAKVLADGTVPTSSSDQFNGVLDEVHFDVR